MLRSSRRGFTLAELTLSLVLLGLVVGAVMTVLARQQRFYRSAASLVATRGQIRQAIGALPADLRAISPAAGDVYALSDHMVEFRANFGSSIVCARPTPNTFIIPPLTLTQNNGLTMWLAQPIGGDSLLAFDDSTAVGDGDDHWDRYAITSAAPVKGVNGCPVAGGLVQLSDTSRASYLITVPAGTPLSGTILIGAPIRFFRRVRYELYQASDLKSYLGFYDCIATRTPVCNSLQKLSGPFRAYSGGTPGASGLLFTYYDSLGSALSATLANAPKVARVKVSVQGQTQSVNISGMPRGTRTDSLTMDVGVRNRK